MRKQDIRPGVVYAYQERTHTPIRPVVILAASPYTHRHKGEPKPLFFPADRYDRVGQTSGRTCGYPAVQHLSGYRGTEPDWNLIAQRMAKFTLADFTAAQDGGIDDDITFGLIDRLACVLGEWDKVTEAEAARRQAEQDRLRRQQEADDRSHKRADAILAALSAAGIKATPGRDDYGNEVHHVRIALGEAEKLAALLGASTEGETSE